MPVVKYAGQQFNFPEGTSQEQMQAGLQEYTVQNLAASQAIPQPDFSKDVRTENIYTPRESYFPDGEAFQDMTPLKGDLATFAENIAEIETGGLQNRSIRTKVWGSTSSAYGKYQITHGLLEGTIKNGTVQFSEAERAAVDELMERQSIALSIGGKDRVKYQAGGSKHELAIAWAQAYGYETVDEFLDAFDYGGDLGLTTDGNFQVLYESVARKLLKKHLDDANGDMIKAAGVWHGGPKGAGKTTEMYKRKMQGLLDVN